MTNVNNGVLTLTMVGRDGAQVRTKDVMKYGLFEIKLQAAAGPGAVSAFFVSACCFCRLSVLLGVALLCCAPFSARVHGVLGLWRGCCVSSAWSSASVGLAGSPQSPLEPH
jgi:hypothetical protein